ncbi:MAG TPA: hypothetical protein ACQGQH_00670 [Xylella sp.]
MHASVVGHGKRLQWCCVWQYWSLPPEYADLVDGVLVEWQMCLVYARLS